MKLYIAKRVMIMIPILILLTFIVFFVIYLIPGDAIDAIQSRSGSTELDREILEAKYGLDAPMITQYARWMGFVPNVEGEYSGLLQGDFGYSIIKKQPVIKLLSEAAPITVELSVLGLMVSLLISMPTGILSATRQGTIRDYLGRSLAIICIAIPGFWLGTLVVVFPSIWWGYAPSLMLVKISKDLLGNLKMFILPAIVLGMTLAGSTMRIARTTMLGTMRQDYIRTAWAKGLQERTIIGRHALKNAIIPVISLIGVQIPYLVGGTVIIEQIFSLAGIGRLVVDALATRDEILLCGIVVLFAAALMMINMLLDVLYAYLNPNIRFK